ncbi:MULTISPECIES: hypothetical protein [unclassified Fibrobacter]|uniref:hypothetical protein n=1 Tax=unclassified Fibrobacter TaxID=2634177 RepID=UPI000D6DB8EC|nr:MULTISPECIES: hypothetical protein [unclassified Fibrobacter]PWJ71919.1 putative Zn finger-like uncharacterized protein [Fibrobacter sp. UWR4]PZW70369.1 putative Zn finger-like uncharacterized protein [Fibrobacter sp. UWR1]
MSNLHIECPHCGASFDLELQGEKANMMVFSCARCGTPLMYCHGEVGELDKDEFANLRKKLTRAIDAAVSRDGNLAPVADALRTMLDKSNEIAEERASEIVEEHAEKPAPLTDESLASLQKELDELDAESFLDRL